MKTSYRWMTWGAALIVIRILACGVWFYTAQEGHAKWEVEHDIMAVAQLKVAQIEAWRSERLADAAVLSSSPFLAHLQSLQTQYHYKDVLLAGPGGRIAWSLSGGHSIYTGANEAVMKAKRDRGPVFTRMHAEPCAPFPHLGAVAPLFDGPGRSGKFLGAVVLVSDARDFLFPLIQSWPIPSKTAETLLVRREGNSVLFLNDLRFRDGAALTLKMPRNQPDLPAAMAAKGVLGVVTGQDYCGREVLAALLPVKDSDWFLVSKMDVREAFAPWRGRSWSIMGGMAGMIA